MSVKELSFYYDKRRSLGFCDWHSSIIGIEPSNDFLELVNKEGGLQNDF